MKRRTFVQAGLSLPFAGLTLSACSGGGAPQSGFYQEGVYLAGNFGPVDVESTVTDLNVTGTIPEELVGRFLRNGPNPIGEVDASRHHWFIGDGMVHGVRLNEGRAEWYRNRWVRSPEIVAALGESIDGRRLSGSANTHVIGHAGRTWAIVESGAPPVELTYELETIGNDPGWGAYTAHPKLDPDTGELHALSYDWANYRDHVKYTVMDPTASLVRSVDIPLPGMPMIHDMSLTENYIVIYDLPVTLSFMALGTGARFPFRWDDDYEPRVGLMPRDGGPEDIVWAPVSQNYAYHPMNAYEAEDGSVVIDICRYDKMFAEDTNGPFGDSLPYLDRWSVNPTTRKVSETRLDDRPQEFPRCHPDLNSKPYRYGYSLGVGMRQFPAIYKHDMQTGQASEYLLGPGRQGAEPIFVPRDDASQEDDGYLITFVYNESGNTSDLVILDALDFGREPLATVHLPVRVPYGFHGSWVSDDA